VIEYDGLNDDERREVDRGVAGLWGKAYMDAARYDLDALRAFVLKGAAARFLAKREHNRRAAAPPSVE
jgi:hypothetical protein